MAPSGAISAGYTLIEDGLVASAEGAQPVLAKDLVDVQAGAEDVGVVTVEVRHL